MQNQLSSNQLRLKANDKSCKVDQNTFFSEVSPKKCVKTKRLYVTPHKNESVEDIRQKIMINRAIEDILTMGRLQRMRFITINNKALFNQGKIKRAQWINNKYWQNRSQSSFLPDLKALKVELKTNSKQKQKLNSPNIKIQLNQTGCKFKNKVSKLSNKMNSVNSVNLVNSKALQQNLAFKQQNYQSLIKQFLSQIQNSDLLSKSNSAEQLVQKRPHQIRRNLCQNKQQYIKKRSPLESEQLKKGSFCSPQKYEGQALPEKLIKTRRKKRSVTQVAYEDQISKVAILKYSDSQELNIRKSTKIRQ